MHTFGMIPSPPDERDYPLSKAVAYAAAPISDICVRFIPTPVNQGATSTCAAVTLAGIIEAAEYKQRGIETPVSIKYLYGNRPEGTYLGEGMVPRELLQTATRFGTPRRELLPGLSDFPASKAAITPALDGEGIPNRIRGYVRLSSLQDIYDYLRLYDLPVFLGVMVYESFMAPGPDGMIPAPAGALLGGHAMRCAGIRDGRVIVQNSWGEDWGDGGFAFIDLSQHRGWEAWGVIPESSDTLIKRPQEMLMTIGSKTVLMDGKAITLDVAPFIKDSRTFVPLRFLVEALGAKVTFVPQPNAGFILMQWGGEQEKLEG